MREAYLEACCLVTKLQYSDALDIVGIATEAGHSEGGSEDAIYFDARDWTEDLRRQAEKDQRDFGILISPTFSYGNEQEYPD